MYKMKLTPYGFVLYYCIFFSFIGCDLNLWVFCEDAVIDGLNATDTTAVDDILPVSWYKCPGSNIALDVPQDAFIIPNFLRKKVNENSVLRWNRAFGPNIYKFRLDTRSQRLSCQVDAIQVNIAINNDNSTVNPTQYEINPFGFLLYTAEIFVDPENFCVASLTPDFLQLEVCLTQTQNENTMARSAQKRQIKPNYPPMIRKCCPGAAILILRLSEKTAKCTASSNFPWRPRFHDSDVDLYPNYNYTKFPNCTPQINVLPYQLQNSSSRTDVVWADIRILKTGQVEKRESGNHNWKVIETKDYCVDGFHEENDETVNYNLQRVNRKNFLIYDCHESAKPDPNPKGPKLLIYTVALIFSSIILLAISISHFLVWSQQNVHGWTIVCFCMSMCSWFVSVVIGIHYNDEGPVCVIVGVLSHFFSLLYFCWLFFLNFDLWSTITSMRAMTQRSKGHQRFIAYCAIAFGLPTLIVTIALIVENRFELFDDRVIRPQYGRRRCALDQSAVVYYGIIPQLIIFILALFFMLLTLIFLWKVKKNCDRFKEGNSAKSGQDKGQQSNTVNVVLMIKLFIIMGISWVFDIISSLASGQDITWYWMIFDLYNYVQALFLFWLFVYKKELRQQLATKYQVFRGLFNLIEKISSWCSVKKQTVTSTSMPTTSFAVSGVDSSQMTDLEETQIRPS